MPAFRPSMYFAAAALVFVLGFQLWISPKNPPGFHHDEVAFTLNAYTIAHHLRDENGGFLPIAFPSYGDYKSAFFSYAVAPAVALFGPRPEVARTVEALFGLAAVLLIGLLAYRRAGPLIGIVATVVAGLTPWLFESGRVAYDSGTVPFEIALVLLAVDFWARSERALWWRATAVGTSLALLAYGSASGRLLCPLLGVALLVFARRRTLAAIAAAWAVLAVLLVPLGVYWIRHGSGLTARYQQTQFKHRGLSTFGIVAHAIRNGLVDINPEHWIVGGDPKPYLAIQGAPQLFAAMVVLALGSVILIVRHGPPDRFWLFVVLGYPISVVPASLTVDRFDSTRLNAMPVFLAVLIVPALVWLRRLPLRPLAVVAIVLGASVAWQWGVFVDKYSNDGPNREVAFDADVPSLLATAFAGTGPVVMDHDDAYARTYATWYAVAHHIPVSRVVRLPDGGVPPKGSMVFGRTQDCDYVCVRLENADSYWIARAEPAG